ncbi:CHAT domain-containing protein [Gymnopilus junonius]|uniref:CHAT domain-containing protein n=1 Tax=Gymnopilus junonius TaxID=109634 RepID=A0A9P5TIB5_GYMJU|nr:CHAT domain-containing protein [Gymnopilus junonius]
MHAEETESWLERNARYKSEKDKILETDPKSFEDISAQQGSEDNIQLFRYFPWPQRMPRDILFPHQLGDFYLMRFERTEDKFNSPALPNFQEHRKWRRDPCDEIILCYEAAIDLAPPDYVAKTDLFQKLAFMLLWRFEVDMEFEDFRRAFLYLQNALDLDGSLTCHERTIRIGWWFLHSFADISGMNNMSNRFPSRLNRLFRHMFLTFYSGGHRTRPINYEELARDVAMFGDHPTLSLLISTSRRNVDVLTCHGLETLAAWYAQRYLCCDRGEDLDDAIAVQNHALLQRMDARKEEQDDEESDSDNDVDEPRRKPRRSKARRRGGLDGDVAVVACGQQLAVWLKLRYEKRRSEEDLECMRALLIKLVMSYSDPTGMYECAFLFSELPLPPQIPYALYDRAILGLHTLAALSLGLGGPLDSMLRLHDSTAFVSKIAAMAISDGHPVKAVEWLENSCSLIWNKITSLGKSAVIVDLERRKFYTSTLSFRMMEAIHQRVLQSTYVDGNLLMRHLTDGPVIMLNASIFGCHALVLRPGVGPKCLPLISLTFERVSGWEKAFQNLLSSLGANIRGEERKDRPSKSPRSTDDDMFQKLLEEIWVALVEPILQFIWTREELMKLVKAKHLPRVWWCRTGPFSFLPIHAAGLYTSCGPQIRLTDFAISSYLPSLSSAISKPPITVPSEFRLLVVAQPSTPDLPTLPGVTQEVASIEKRAHSVQKIILTGEQATKTAVKEEAASAVWLHAACHGKQNGTHSSFALYDGPLSLHRLAALPHLAAAEFAFLSACETATGDSDLSGEAMHLAGGLYRLGYRSVIATMFSVRDRDAPFVADKVYEQLFEDKRPDYRKAAQALHRAIHLLQEVNGRGNFRAWVPFLHIGD